MPLGSSPAFSIWAIVPTFAYTAVDPGHEHQPAPGLLGGGAGALRLVGLERDRDDHLREHDALREREHRKQLRARVGLGVELAGFEFGGVLVGHVVPVLVVR